MLKIRRSRDRLIFNMGIPLMERRSLYWNEAQGCNLGNDCHGDTPYHVITIVMTWWRHQMETFPCYWPFVRGIHRSQVNSPHKGQSHGALIFSLMCVWINGWVNNCKAGDLRRYRAHYDVSLMTERYTSVTVRHSLRRRHYNPHCCLDYQKLSANVFPCLNILTSIMHRYKVSV